MKSKLLVLILVVLSSAQVNAAFINFNSLTAGSYDGPDSFQDVNGTFSLSDGGLTATITGNAWKVFSGGTFEIDSSTVLHFLFSADGVVEVGAIGFDTDTAASSASELLKLAGWQNYGTTVYDYTVGDGVVAVSVNIGALYASGTYSNIFLVLDKDAGDQGLSLSFSNVELCSAGEACVTTGEAVEVDEPVSLFSLGILFLSLGLYRKSRIKSI